MWLLLLFLLGAAPAWAEDLGELSANPFNPDSTSNPFGAEIGLYVGAIGIKYTKVPHIWYIIY